MQAKYLLLLRAVLIEILLLHVLYAPGGTAWARGWLWVLLGVYAACAGLLHWMARSRRLSERRLAFSFILDVGLTSAILYGVGDIGSDLYIAYFLVILTSCLQEDLGYSFIVGFASCVVYGALAFKGSSWLSQPFYLLHTSLLLLTAFFSAYVATTAKRVEEKLEERFEQKVAWMQRLSWAGQALASVLHEVRTPLNTVLLSCEYAQSRLAKGETSELPRLLETVARETQRAAAIVSNYLEFSKPSELVLTELPIQQPLRGALASMSVWFDDRGIALKEDFGEDCLVRGSERHLVQVFTNLLSNSIEAMPFGGTVEIRVERGEGRVRVSVRDTGTGVSPEMMDKLFKPFATSRDDYEGHGLGLSIARWIVQKHAGAITVESAGTGKGTLAVVDLPLLSAGGS